jgi:hypothetical protein
MYFGFETKDFENVNSLVDFYFLMLLHFGYANAYA